MTGVRCLLARTTVGMIGLKRLLDRPHRALAVDAPASALCGDAGREPMKCSRRGFLDVATGAVALSAVSRIGWAQAYPTRPVRWLVGFAPAGGNDIVARLMGQWLSEPTGQQFLVENRAGAATNIPTPIPLHAPAPGHTPLLGGGSAPT